MMPLMASCGDTRAAVLQARHTVGASEAQLLCDAATPRVKMSWRCPARSDPGASGHPSASSHCDAIGQLSCCRSDAQRNTAHRHNGQDRGQRASSCCLFFPGALLVWNLLLTKPPLVLISAPRISKPRSWSASVMRARTPGLSTVWKVMMNPGLAPAGSNESTSTAVSASIADLRNEIGSDLSSWTGAATALPPPTVARITLLISFTLASVRGAPSFALTRKVFLAERPGSGVVTLACERQEGSRSGHRQPPYSGS